MSNRPYGRQPADEKARMWVGTNHWLTAYYAEIVEYRVEGEGKIPTIYRCWDVPGPLRTPERRDQFLSLLADALS